MRAWPLIVVAAGLTIGSVLMALPPSMWIESAILAWLAIGAVFVALLAQVFEIRRRS